MRKVLESLRLGPLQQSTYQHLADSCALHTCVYIYICMYVSVHINVCKRDLLGSFDEGVVET